MYKDYNMTQLNLQRKLQYLFPQMIFHDMTGLILFCDELIMNL